MARPTRTLVRSISFDSDVFEAIEERRRGLRMTRSEFLRAILEDHLGMVEHPELKLKITRGKKTSP